MWCWSCKTLGRGGVKGMEIGQVRVCVCVQQPGRQASWVRAHQLPQAMPVSRENAFRIVAAADATAAKDERTFAASTLESVLDKVRPPALARTRLRSCDAHLLSPYRFGRRPATRLPTLLLPFARWMLMAAAR